MARIILLGDERAATWAASDGSGSASIPPLVLATLTSAQYEGLDSIDSDAAHAYVEAHVARERVVDLGRILPALAELIQVTHLLDEPNFDRLHPEDRLAIGSAENYEEIKKFISMFIEQSW